MNVLVMTSDKYLHALPVFAHLFNKYWSPTQHVIVSGFAAPDFELPSNFTFFSLGSQTAYPFHKWSNALHDTLQHFPTLHHFILMLEDYWLNRPVRIDVVESTWAYAVAHPEVVKFDLMAERRYNANVEPYGDLDGIAMVRSLHHSEYHSSLMTGIWHTKMLLRYLIPDESPHDLELRGTERLATIADLEVVGLVTDPWPVSHILAFRGQEPNKLLIGGLLEEDREWVKEYYASTLVS